VPARVARAPNPDVVGINLRQKFEKGDSAPPIGDLAPWIDVVTDRAVARPEIPVVMQEHDESRFGDGASEALEPVYTGIAVGCRDRGTRSSLPLRLEEPTAESIAALDSKSTSRRSTINPP